MNATPTTVTFALNGDQPLSGLQTAGLIFTAKTSGSLVSGNSGSYTVGNIQHTPGSNVITFDVTLTQAAITAGINWVNLSVQLGYVNSYVVPQTYQYENQNYCDVASAVFASPSTVLPSVTVDTPSSGNLSSGVVITGTDSANGGSAISTVLVTVINPSGGGLYATDGSGSVVNRAATLNGNGTWSFNFNSTTAGKFEVFATTTDAAGNTVATPLSSTFQIIDNVPPVTTASTYYKSGTRYYAVSAQANGWFNYQYTSGGIYFQLGASDAGTGNSGIAATYYTIDGGSQQTYTTGSYIQVAGNGQHTVTYWSMDGAGNIETAHTLPIRIDTTVPTVTVTQPQNGVYGTPDTLTGTWTAGPSGVNISVSVYDYTDHYPYITIAEQGSGNTAFRTCRRPSIRTGPGA